MFKTQAEVFKAMIDGYEVRRISWGEGEFVKLQDGFCVNQEGQSYTPVFTRPQEWSIVEKPKPPRKLYAWRFGGDDLDSVCFSTSPDAPLWWLASQSRYERASEFDITYKDE